MTGVLLCLLPLLLFVPQPAYAAPFKFSNPFTNAIAVDPVTGDVCPLEDSKGNQLQDTNGNILPKTAGLTRRIVPCIEGVILYAANQILGGISTFMAGTVSVACVLALALWGMLMASGKSSESVRGMLSLGIKIGGVVMFATNFAAPYFDPGNVSGGFFGMMLDTMNYMLGVVTNYVLQTNIFASNTACAIPKADMTGVGGYSYNAVWDTVDCMIEILIGGIFDPTTLLFGIIGFFLAALLSNAVGFFIGAMGFYIIIQLLFAIARACYVVISSYIAFAIMVMISPFFVPLILFRATKAYFLKWLRLTMSFMIQPVIIFAYLGMLVVAFDTVVYSGTNSLYRAIAGNTVGPLGSVNVNFEAGAWLLCGAKVGGCPAGTKIVSCDVPAGNGAGQRPGVYCRGGIGSQAIPVNQKAIRQAFGIPAPVDNAELGRMGQIMNYQCNGTGDPAQACSNSFFSKLGIGGNYCQSSVDGSNCGSCTTAGSGCACTNGAVAGSAGTCMASGVRFFRIGMPVTIIDWNYLAQVNKVLLPDGTPDVTTYTLDLFLSALMAAITVYIFMMILDKLPLVSAGISGNPYGAVFGQAGTVPSIIEKLSWNPAEPPAGFGK